MADANHTARAAVLERFATIRQSRRCQALLSEPAVFAPRTHALSVDRARRPVDRARGVPTRSTRCIHSADSRSPRSTLRKIARYGRYMRATSEPPETAVRSRRAYAGCAFMLSTIDLRTRAWYSSLEILPLLNNRHVAFFNLLFFSCCSALSA